MRITDLEPEYEEAAVAQLNDLLDCLETDENRLAFRQRLIEGEWGFWYFNEYPGSKYKVCGCAYGTASIILLDIENDQRSTTSEGAGMRLVKTLMSEALKYGDVCYLEKISFDIRYGSTPENNENAKWVLEHIDKYLGEKHG